MSYVQYKSLIEEGDEVVLKLRHEHMAVKVRKSGPIHCGSDTYDHSQLLGKAFGSKVVAHRGRGFAYALHPTPELWTAVLPHRTQILYAADIGFVVHMLDLRPGSVVVESGTGSGSLTHALARAVSPGGRVYTFDFHMGRVEKAREEFARHGLSEVVVAGHADAIRDGFALENVADAVFLDLPHPEQAVVHALRALKRTGGRICSFSPCIEQVQATCDELRLRQCTDIRTFEVLERQFESRSVNIPELDTAARPQRHQSEGREQAAGPRQSKAEDGPDDGHNDEEQVANSDEEIAAKAEDGDGEAQAAKKSKIGGTASTADSTTASSTAPPHDGQNKSNSSSVTVTYIQGDIQGHTGYLTFASVIPHEALLPVGSQREEAGHDDEEKATAGAAAEANVTTASSQ